MFTLACSTQACMLGGSGEGEDPGDDPSALAPPPTDEAQSVNGMSAGAVRNGSLLTNAPLLRELLASPFNNVGPNVAYEIKSNSDSNLLFANIIRCALPAGESVTVKTGTWSHTFYGELGYAPDWETKVMPKGAPEWVSACVLAHTNFDAKHIRINLVSSNPTASTAPAGSNGGSSSSTSLNVKYPRAEGTYWGNIFAFDPSKQFSQPAQQRYACYLDKDLMVRTCGEDIMNQSLCGDYLHGAGKGYAITSCGIPTCTTIIGNSKTSSTNYTSCNVDSRTFDKTVTVYRLP